MTAAALKTATERELRGDEAQECRAKRKQTRASHLLWCKHGTKPKAMVVVRGLAGHCVRPAASPRHHCLRSPWSNCGGDLSREPEAQGRPPVQGPARTECRRTSGNF